MGIGKTLAGMIFSAVVGMSGSACAAEAFVYDISENKKVVYIEGATEDCMIPKNDYKGKTINCMVVREPGRMTYMKDTEDVRSLRQSGYEGALLEQIVFSESGGKTEQHVPVAKPEKDNNAHEANKQLFDKWNSFYNLRRINIRATQYEKFRQNGLQMFWRP